MSAVAPSSPAAIPAPAPPLPMYRFTVKQYHGLIQAGVLNEDDRCELLEGWIVAKMPQNPPHAAAVMRISRRLERQIPDGWVIRTQCPVTLRDSEPEPDVVVARGSESTYDTHHPSPKEVAVLVEVADSTLLSDRGVKGPLYARVGIPVYWIAHLIDRRMEVYAEPKSGKSPSYRDRRDYGVAESIPLVLDGREVARIPVRNLLR